MLLWGAKNNPWLVNAFDRTADVGSVDTDCHVDRLSAPRLADRRKVRPASMTQVDAHWRGSYDPTRPGFHKALGTSPKSAIKPHRSRKKSLNFDQRVVPHEAPIGFSPTCRQL